MAKFICLICALIPFYLFSQTDVECSAFKYGEFTYPLAKNGAGYEIRYDDTQVTYSADAHKLLVWKVVWKDDCHYSMKIIEVYSGSGLWSIGDIIEVEINSIKNNCYGYRAIMDIKNEEIYTGPLEFDGMMCKEEDI